MITLLPKVSAPEYFSQFRLISLCNVSFKILKKVFTNRLCQVFPHLIDLVQCNFIPERQVHDNVVTYEEKIHIMYTKTCLEGVIAVKIDMEKMFDRVD